MNVYADNAGRDNDSSSQCVLVVASYTEKADLVGAQTEIGANRVLMTPTLGDVVEVRFLDLGTRYADPETGWVATAMLAEYIRDCLAEDDNATAPTSFAVLLVDSSRQTVRRALQDWIQDPMLAAMRVQFSGAATVDDELEPVEGSALTRGIATLPVEGLTDGGLARLVVRIAEAMLVEVAGGGRRGVTRSTVCAFEALDGLETVDTAETPVHAALESVDAASKAAESDIAEVVDVAMPEPITAAHRHRNDELVPETAVEGHFVGEPPSVAGAVEMQVQSRLTKPAPSVDTVEVIYLLLDVMHGLAAASPRRIGKFISELADSLNRTDELCRLRLRVVPGSNGDEATAAMPLRDVIKKPPSRPRNDTPLADRIRWIAEAVRRNRRFLPDGADTSVARVIVYSAAAPLADAITVAAYDELTELATVVWIVSPAELPMMSAHFLATSEVVVDNPEAAKEVTNLFQLATTTPHTQGDRR